MGGVFIKMLPWPPLAVAGARSGIAGLVIFLFLGAKNLKFEREDFIAAIFYALTVTLFVSATKLTTAANAVFLQYTAPVYVIALAHFYLGEKTTSRDIKTVVVVIAGMTLFFYEKVSMEGLWGNILAICSGVTFAVMTVLLRERKNALPLRAILLGNLICAVSLSPFVLQAPALDLTGLMCLIILGVFQLGLAYVVYAKAVPHVSAIETVLIATLEPVLNPLWVILTLGEVPSVYSIIGGGVIIAAVTFRALMPARAPLGARNL